MDTPRNGQIENGKCQILKTKMKMKRGKSEETTQLNMDKTGNDTS